MHAAQDQPPHKRQQRHQEIRRSKPDHIDHHPRAQGANEVGDGRADGEPTERRAQLIHILGHAPHMALQRNDHQTTGGAAAQGGQAQHQGVGPQGRQQGPCAGHHGGQGETQLDPVALDHLARWQCQEDLAEGKQRQQHPDGRSALTGTQQHQRRRHAQPRHTRVQAHLGADPLRQLFFHSASPSSAEGNKPGTCSMGSASTLLKARRI